MSSDKNQMGCVDGILLNITVWGSFTLALDLAKRFGFSVILSWISLMAVCAIIWRFSPLVYAKAKSLVRRIYDSIERCISTYRFIMRYRSCTQTEAQSLLFESIVTGNIKHIQIALNKGADINMRNDKNVTPLMTAASGKQFINPYYREWDEASCEEHGYIKSNPDILRLLLNKNPDRENVIESYRLAQIGGRNANFGPWATEITEVTNTTAIEILSEYMDRHGIVSK